ncbi:MAG TPA: hypothetical protein VFV50_10375 [Bdellovibrionales bacterium]|nr:hypothetical protein [Bdellovibrionales bacterium]
MMRALIALILVFTGHNASAETALQITTCVEQVASGRVHVLKLLDVYSSQGNYNEVEVTVFEDNRRRQVMGRPYSLRIEVEKSAPTMIKKATGENFELTIDVSARPVNTGYPSFTRSVNRSTGGIVRKEYLCYQSPNTRF